MNADQRCALLRGDIDDPRSSVVTMAVNRPPHSTGTRRQLQRTRLNEPCGTATVADRKTRQAAKIRELGDALIASGIVTLDAQAEALGLSRSTTWTILKGNHKSSGLSAAIINRMLAAPQLPPLVRAKVLEYIEEKTAGLYGDCQPRLRKFVALLSISPRARRIAPALQLNPRAYENAVGRILRATSFPKKAL